jgi:hypothetical protein
VSQLSACLSRATEANRASAKNVLRYLKQTRSLSLNFRKMPETIFQLSGYCDATWASDPVTRRSVTGYCFRLGDDSQGSVSWCSRKQQTVALSSTEAEYLAVSAATQEILFLRAILKDVGVSSQGATVLFEDNMGCISLASNPVMHKRSKHIDTRHHFVRDMVKGGIIKLCHVPTGEMVADALTKALPRPKTELLRGKLLGKL